MRTHLLPRRELLKSTGALLLIGALSRAARGRAADGRPRIGIIGAGRVGSALGRVWAAAGYAVMFASRNPEQDRQLAAQAGPGARAGTPREAAAFGDVLLFAVPYGALPELGRALAPELRGKVVLDACNPFPQRDGAVAEQARTLGAGLYSAQLLPGARIVRAFNAIGAARMGSVHEHPGVVGMPIAGDDPQALRIAARLVRAIGFAPVTVGGLAMGRYLMPGTPLAGEHPPQEIRRIAATLAP